MQIPVQVSGEIRTRERSRRGTFARDMADRLTPLDATFLELEQVDDCAHMHIGGALVFDPRPDGSIPTIQELRESMSERLGQLPRYRQRLSSPRTGGLNWPSWEEDPHLDMTAHIRRAALPAPGGEEELCDWLADFWSHRLDRGRPLWEAVALEGLEGGRWALATKTHHAMVDGVGSIDVGALMLDAEPEPPHAPDAPPAELPRTAAPPPRAGHSRASRVAGVLRWAPEQLVRTARFGADVTLHPHKAAEMLERSRAAVQVLLRDELVGAPQSSLNCRIGSTRGFAVVRVPLADVKDIKRALGGTVNDVVLASVTGGLRRLLDARSEALPERGLRAMVPMNVRQASEHLALGNKVSSLFVHLPVAAETTQARYARVMAEAEELKSSSQSVGTSTIISVAGLAPPALHATLARSLYATRLFNVTVTNVPGPQLPLYAHGARLREILPWVPLAAEHAVGVAILSYDGGLFFGVSVGAEAVPDLEILRDGIAAELDELRELAGLAHSGAAG
jgi:diacylglycerol O-acyltransferase / wax synthase